MATTHVTNAMPSTPDLLLARLQEIKRLIVTYAGFADVRLFHRAVSLQTTDQVKFPCCFVHPEVWDPKLVSNAKYDLRGTVGLHLYITGNDAEAVGEETLRAVSVLDKLFSNNALDDRNTASPTNSFLYNAGFWVESEFGPVAIAPILSSATTENDQGFMGGAKCGFKFHDVVFE